MDGEDFELNSYKLNMIDNSIEVNSVKLEQCPKCLSSIQESDNDMSCNDNYYSKKNLMRSSPTIKEEDLMALSRESDKDTKQIEDEINQLIKRKETDSDLYISNQKMAFNDSNKLKLQSLFESCIRENLVLGENFIIVWLDKQGTPSNFYERAKHNLFIEQKFENKIITEDLFMNEVLKQAKKELEIKSMKN